MNIKGLLFVCALLSAAMFSCKKDDDNNLPASMNATVNSVTVSETDTTVNSSVDVNFITRKAIMTNGVITITGTSLALDVVNITIKGTTVGTYDLSIDLLNPKTQCLGSIYTTYVNANNETNSALFESKEGTVVLTTVDTANKVVSGTYEFFVFSGDVYKTITKGTFENLKYTVK